MILRKNAVSFSLESKPVLFWKTIFMLQKIGLRYTKWETTANNQETKRRKEKQITGIMG